MHSLDVDPDVWPRSHPARMYAIISPGANAVTRRWSIVTQSGVVAGSSCRSERGVASRDHRPRVRVGGRFAGEVPRVELGDGGVEVVEVEHDDRRDLIVES